jgi:hypothetical protein
MKQRSPGTTNWSWHSWHSHRFLKRYPVATTESLSTEREQAQIWQRSLVFASGAVSHEISRASATASARSVQCRVAPRTEKTSGPLWLPTTLTPSAHNARRQLQAARNRPAGLDAPLEGAPTDSCTP